MAIEIVPKQKHSINAAIYSISNAFERASFFGVRFAIFSYLVTFFITEPEKKAYELFGWFLIAISISKVIGALLGDLLFKPKTLIIWGGFLQTLGCITLSFDNYYWNLSGMGLIAIGSGLYSSNTIAQFARFYLNKDKIIDAGFSIFYLATNIGSFLGVLGISLVQAQYGSNYSFLLAAGCTLISTLILLFYKEEQIDLTAHSLQPKIKNRISLLVICFIAVGLYWHFYGITVTAFEDIQFSISDIYTNNFYHSHWDILNSIVTFLFFVITAIIWTSFYYNQITKIIIAFISLAFGFAVLLLIDNPNSGNALSLAIVASIIIGFAEVHIIPVLNSLITRSINPKFLAIAFSIAHLPGILITKLLFDLKLGTNTELNNHEILLIGISVLSFVGLILLILVKLGILKTTYNE